MGRRWRDECAELQRNESESEGYVVSSGLVNVGGPSCPDSAATGNVGGIIQLFVYVIGVRP